MVMKAICRNEQMPATFTYENASYEISYRRFTINFLLISSMPVTELQLIKRWQHCDAQACAHGYYDWLL